MTRPMTPAVDGWFTDGDEAHLVGRSCPSCGTYVFPPTATMCPNPSCGSTELDEVALSRTGTVWSWTTNHYQPPPPYVSPEPFEPYTVVAVELATEHLVVLGQLSEAARPADLSVGAPVELVVETLFVDDDGDRTVWRWKPTNDTGEGSS